MHAGVVQYKLCNKNFYCDNCEFHKVMKGLTPKKSKSETVISDIFQSEREFLKQHSIEYYRVINQFLYKLISGYKIHLDRYYYPNQLWVKPEKKDMYQIGVDMLSARILDPIDEIILPEKGCEYAKGDAILKIIRKGKNITLKSYMDGMISKINPLMGKMNLKRLFLKDVYLFKMKIKNPQQKLFPIIGKLDNLKWCTIKIELLNNSIREAFKFDKGNGLGVTLADGGDLIADLEKILGKKLYKNLIFDLYINPDFY
ncbi:hypothetical protein ACFL4T_05770 [candidate division KSB1 bacterium]